MNTTKYSFVTMPVPNGKSEEKVNKFFVHLNDYNYVENLHKRSIEHASRQAEFLNHQHNNILRKVNRGWEIQIENYRREVDKYMRQVFEWQQQQELREKKTWELIQDLERRIVEITHAARNQDVGLGRFYPGMNSARFVQKFRFFMKINDLPNEPAYLIRMFKHYMHYGAFDWVSAVLDDEKKYHIFFKDFNKFLEDFVTRF